MKQLAFALVTIGMLAGAPAFAADMAVKAPPPPPAPATTWTGFYVGGNGGWGGKDPKVTFTPNDVLLAATTCGGTFGGTCAPQASFNLNGALGGVQIGYNQQINQTWLLGWEADFDWSNLKGTGISNFQLATTPGQLVASENVDWFGTVRARVGLLPLNNLLLFASGGLAYGKVGTQVGLNSPITEVNGSGHSYNCTNSGGTGTNCFLGNSSHIQAGFAVGTGAEYLIWHNVSVKAEYLYVNLGPGPATNVVAQATFGAPNPSSFTAGYSVVDFHVVRGGINWKFD
jgi:outer membrane immunogenic protein